MTKIKKLVVQALVPTKETPASKPLIVKSHVRSGGLSMGQPVKDWIEAS